MRKIVTAAFVSLDGVMQAPGGPEEDPSGGFKYGGWTEPYWDEVGGAEIANLFAQPFDLLLGRTTYDIFAAYWPFIAAKEEASRVDDGDKLIAKQFNSVTKYVATHRHQNLSWQNSRSLGNDVVASLRALKKEDGPILLTQGSSNLIQTLLKHDLIDELKLITFPILLGRGKRLFGEGTQPCAFKLTKSTVSPSGVVIANYERAGAVKTGTFVVDEPSAQELERRKKMKEMELVES